MKFNATAIPNYVNASTLTWQLRTCAVCTELELAPKYSIYMKVVECTATFRDLRNIQYLLDLILAEVKISLLNHSNFNAFYNKYLRFYEKHSFFMIIWSIKFVCVLIYCFIIYYSNIRCLTICVVLFTLVLRLGVSTLI